MSEVGRLTGRGGLPLILAGAVALGGCGGASHARPPLPLAVRAPMRHQAPAALPVAPRPPGRAAPACLDLVAGTVTRVAERVYAIGATGRNAAASVGRVRGSRALAAAVARGDARAARSALGGLLAGQIAEVRVSRGSRPLATIGQALTLSPVSGPLRDPRGAVVGSYTLSVLSATAYASVVRTLTGAHVSIRAGSRRLLDTLAPGPAVIPDRGALTYRGASYRPISFAGRSFSGQPLRISILTPAGGARACSADPAQSVANVYGGLARRLYAAERASRGVLRTYTGSAALRSAVLRSDRAAAARVVDAIYHRHIHVVRVRVFRGRGLLLDRGVPFALAPLGGPLRAGRRLIGRVELSTQDDLGFGKLIHNFTGADVLLTVGGRARPGSTLGGLRRAPDSGPFVVRGRRYHVYSFQAQAFPAGTLRITVLSRP